MPREGEVEIKISADGSVVEAEGKNFKGPACLDFMGDILKGLGGDDVEIKKKPEYHQSSGSGVKVGA